MSIEFRLFDAGESLAVAPSARPRSLRRRPGTALFGESDRASGGGGRFAWQPGESLAEFTSRTAGRRRRREELPKDVREVKGGAMQARPWVGPARDANVNLGLFHPEEYGNDRDAAISAAARAAREFKKAMAWAGADIWDVIQQLQRATRFGLPVVPLHVLPPLVRRVRGQDDVYTVRGRDDVVYATVEEAWAVAREVFLSRTSRAQNAAPARIAV